MKINTPLKSGDANGDLGTSELNLVVAPRSNRRRKRHSVSRSRAAYWFNQMRKVVNAARDWQAAPTARPHQTYINLRPTDF